MSGRRQRKFQESCCERRQNSSELSQQSTKPERLDQKESKEQQQLRRDRRCLCLLLNFQLKQTLTQPSVQVPPGGLMWVKFFFPNILALHFHRTSVRSEVLSMQSSPEQHTQHPATNTSIPWLVMCVHMVYIYIRAKTITNKWVLKAQETQELS